jgi:hypothetical protein
MALLKMFEAAGREADSRKEFLSWTVPVTGFRAEQQYMTGSVKKLWITYGPPEGPRTSTGKWKNSKQINVAFNEDRVYATGKQAQGAAPNIIHSLDAAHLMLLVNRCDYPLSTVHDSFGCHLANMEDLFRKSRETFVELYTGDPLAEIFKDLGLDINAIDRGTLDVTEILNSDYCFL